jgi:hypothetical protein
MTDNDKDGGAGCVADDGDKYDIYRMFNSVKSSS